MSSIEQRIAVIDGRQAFNDALECDSLCSLIKQSEADILFAYNALPAGSDKKVAAHLSAFRDATGYEMPFESCFSRGFTNEPRALLLSNLADDSSIESKEVGRIKTLSLELPIGKLACVQVSRRSGMHDIQTAVDCISQEADICIGNVATHRTGWVDYDVEKKPSVLQRLFGRIGSDQRYEESTPVGPGARYEPGPYGYARFRGYVPLGMRPRKQLLSDMLCREGVGLRYSDVEHLRDKNLRGIAATFSRTTLT